MKPFDASLFGVALVCILTSSEVVHASKLRQESSARANYLRPSSDDAQPATISDLVREAEGADDATEEITQIVKEERPLQQAKGADDAADQEKPLQQAKGVDDAANQAMEVVRELPMEEALQQDDGLNYTANQVTQVAEVVKKVPSESVLAGSSALALPMDVSAIVALAEEDPHTLDLVKTETGRSEPKKQTETNRPQREKGELLQPASRFTKSNAPAAVREALEENGVADDPKLRKLENSLLGLAKMADNNSTRMIVDEMRHLVQDVMLLAILNQTQTAEEQVLALHRRFSQCLNMTSHRLQTYPMPNWTNLSGSHKSCRWDQAAMSTPTEELWRLVIEAEKHMNESCHLYDNVNDVIPGYDECGQPSPGGMRNYIVGLIDKFRVRLDGVILDREKCENATRMYEYRKRQWMLSNASVDCKKEECDGLQLEMDVAACNFTTAVGSICYEYNRCYNHTRCSYSSALATAQELLERLRPEYRALKRIECILLEWLADNLDDGIETCRNKTHSLEPLELNLTGLDVPNKTSCRAPTEPWTIYHPTSQEYFQNEYAWLPPNARADTCRAWCCVTPE